MPRVIPMTHEPVLLAEMLGALAPGAGELHVDATFGGGGYARAILDRAPCRLVGLDRDPDAVRRGQALAREEPRFAMVEARFGALEAALAGLGIDAVDGIVLDLGVSSFQLDDPDRGFSFQHDGPLDMRMDRGGDGAGESAAELVARLDEAGLARLFRDYGEEPEAGRIARAIVAHRRDRPIRTTGELAALVARAKRRGKPGRDPATAVFQALRIAVNDELGELARALEASERLLRHGGRLVVVSFHSLEDRLVKRFVDERGGREVRPSRHLPPAEAPPPARFRWPRRTVVKPSAAEAGRNPRARSARLRAALRLRADDETVEPEGRRAA